MRHSRISVALILFVLLLGTLSFNFLYDRPAQTRAEVPSGENLALGRLVTASSSVEIAKVLVDGQEAPNASWHTSWSPPQTPARPSWIMLDLGREEDLQRLAITFSVAAYDGIYDIWAPPASIEIEIGDRSDKTRPVQTIPAASIPENGACADARRLDVRLQKQIRGRYVKLVFPNGGKLAAMPDVVGLGEIAAYTQPAVLPKRELVQLEGAFGRAVLDTDSPQLVGLFLRQPDGQLAKRSLLAGPPRGLTLFEARTRKVFQRTGSYTYVSAKSGQRYESRRSRSHKTLIQTGPGGEVEKIVLTGIVPQSADGSPGPLHEDWTLQKSPNGSLSWSVTQRWTQAFSADISGTPAIHLARFGGWGAFRDRRVDPADPQVTSTLWFDPNRIKSGTHPDYETYTTPWTTEFRTHTLDVRDTWAIYKMFTNFHLEADLRLEVKNGYLYRRAGVRNDFNEIGATSESEAGFDRKAGDETTVTLIVASVDKYSSGQQLAVDIPDRALGQRLRDLHGSILNGGAISDPKRYDFGNGSEDANYAGSADFQARALAVSTMSGALSAHPYDADAAFKHHLERILDTVDERGLTRFGFNASHNGELIDDNLHIISAARTYAVKTGDRKFVQKHYLTFNRMIDFFMSHVDKSNGLFRSPAKGAHWYYDGIPFSGYNTYYQAFLFQALNDLAEMAEITGRRNDAAVRRSQSGRLARAINARLWLPDAPGGPRYADWIDESGKKAANFIDIAQYPLIAFGIAPRDRAEAMLVTADRRLAELKERFGHTRNASLSMLWPLSPARGERCFGTYFYGGSILSSTYWEVLARARAGHVGGEWGAYRLLQNFGERFAEMSFVGSNSIDIRGNISLGGDEPYLADMVVVPAALIHGLLGVDAGWNEIRVAPALPSEWAGAKTSFMWKGRLHEISIQGRRVDIVSK